MKHDIETQATAPISAIAALKVAAMTATIATQTANNNQKTDKL